MNKAEETGTKVWRSLGQLEDTPQFREYLEREFPEGSAQIETEEDREVTRRSFMKLMGASTALAGFGLASCRRPESLIVPFAEAPEWVIPGKPLYYASSMPAAKGAASLVVTTHEGRPTKIEPNRLFSKQGGTGTFAQASVLNMYDPARSRDFVKAGKTVTRIEFEEFAKELSADLNKTAFVFGEDNSATRDRLVGEIAAKHSGSKFYKYEALAGEGQKLANEKVFGKGSAVIADYSKAERILSLDADFLEMDQQGPVSGFYNNRAVEGPQYDQKPDKNRINRLYIAEGIFSLTGGMADHRLRIAPSQIVRIAAAVAVELGVSTQVPAGALGEFEQKWVKECAADLKAHAGHSVVVAGSRHSEAVQQLVIAINQKLGSYGKTLKPVVTNSGAYGKLTDLLADIDSGAVENVILVGPANPVYDAAGFAAAAKKLKNLVHLGERLDATANAASWHVPAAHYLESWGDSYAADGRYTVVQPMILPLYGGVSELDLLVALLTGSKLFNSITEGAKLSPAYKEVRKTFEGIGGAGDAAWTKLLRDGFSDKGAYAAAQVGAADLSAVAGAAVAAPTVEALEISFLADPSVLDGRYINNAWLQEAPDPLTKITWDNCAMISPQTAKDLGLYEKLVQLEPKGKLYGMVDVSKPNAPVGPDGEGRDRAQPVIKVVVNGAELEIPVMVAFGQADNLISIALGYGQGYDEHNELGLSTEGAANVSQVGVNTGFNAYLLRTAETPYIATGAKIEDLDKRYSTAVTQEHHSMYGRAIAREISTNDVEHKGSFEKQLEGVKKQGVDSHAPPNISLYKQKGSSTWHDKYQADEHLFDKRQQWAMTIDLNSCTGCNACLVACQAENNIPVVGKTQVAIGRAMHWIRMDRYFAAVQKTDINGQLITEDDGHGHQVPVYDESNPEMIPQPVACQQCESAPCETVCPVNATVHSEDGLNTMAYNRCIGTRYCANNCPYKARRFNFFDYNKRNPLVHKNLYKGPLGEKQVGEAPHLQRNPNVSVRMRGVMEKCTYCVQRLQEAKIKAKSVLKNKSVAAGVPSAEVSVSDAEMRPPVNSVRVACQDACEAGAITFGNIQNGDKETVVRARDSKRNYALLNYIGTMPRTTYLARVKNPNAKMPDAKAIGKATISMH